MVSRIYRYTLWSFTCWQCLFAGSPKNMFCACWGPSVSSDIMFGDRSVYGKGHSTIKVFITFGKESGSEKDILWIHTVRALSTPKSNTCLVGTENLKQKGQEFASKRFYVSLSVSIEISQFVPDSKQKTGSTFRQHQELINHLNHSEEKTSTNYSVPAEFLVRYSDSHWSPCFDLCIFYF